MLLKSSKEKDAAKKEKEKEKAAAEQNMRNEVLDGAKARADVAAEVNKTAEAEMTTEQLIKKAQTTHQDTTATAQRALRIVENTKQVQQATMVELDKQGKALDKIEQHVNKMNDDLTYSEKLLRYMRRCCCCWMCDSCTGADPEERRKNQWNRDVQRGRTQTMVINSSNKNTMGPASGVSPAKLQYNVKGAKYKAEEKEEEKPEPRQGDPDIRLDTKHAAAETGLHAETRKQNEIFDQIGSGLDALMEGAKNMNEGLASQAEKVDSIMGRTEGTASRVKGMNTHSQLGMFKSKKK